MIIQTANCPLFSKEFAGIPSRNDKVREIYRFYVNKIVSLKKILSIT